MDNQTFAHKPISGASIRKDNFIENALTSLDAHQAFTQELIKKIDLVADNLFGPAPPGVGNRLNSCGEGSLNLSLENRLRDAVDLVGACLADLSVALLRLESLQK